MSMDAGLQTLKVAFSYQEQKALLCDAHGIVIAVSQTLCQFLKQPESYFLNQPALIFNQRFNEQYPWYKNLNSHHHETRVSGQIVVGNQRDELTDLQLITLQPLKHEQTLIGFRVVLETESAFEKTVPFSAWQTLFNDSNVGICLFDDTFTVLSSNPHFDSITGKQPGERQKIYDLLKVGSSFKDWFFNAKHLSSEAILTREPDTDSVFITVSPTRVGGAELYWCIVKDADFVVREKEKLSNSFELFRNLFDSNMSGIALATRDGIYIEANQKFADMVQLDRSDVIGKHFSYFNAPESFELPEEEAEVFMKTGFCRPFEKTLVRSNGTRVKVAVQLFPNFDEQGNFVGAWNYIHLMDTDRQENIDRTRYFELLFTNSQEAMVLTDLNGKIRMVNRAFAELLKADIKELQGELLDNLTVEEDLIREKVQHQEVLLKQGYTELYEKRLHRLDGTMVPTSVRSVLVKDPGGRAEAIWMIARESSIQRKLIQSLANSERRFRSLFSNSIDAIGLWTANDELQYANKAYLDLVGYSQEELRNLTYKDFTPPGWEEADQKMSDQVQQRGYSDIFEKEVLSKDGRRIPISIRASAMTDSDGSILGSWVIIRDISEHKDTLRKLLHSQNMLQQTSRMSRVGGWEFDLHKETFVITEETYQILSIPRSYHTSLKNIAKLFEPESEQRAIEMVRSVVKSAKPGSSELKLLGFSPERWIRVSAQLAYEESGHKYVYGAVQDITDFMEQQKNLENARDNFQRMAFHDPLTNLPNRLLLEDRFQQITNQARRDQKMVALIIIDLDDFKAINDKYGHPAGDELLIQLAKRLQNTIRSSDTVARLGGDEFVVIAMLKDEQQAISLAEKILQNVRKTVNWQSSIELNSSCSMGVAMAPDYDQSFEELYAQADEALYRVKESGKGSFSLAKPNEQ